MVVDDGVNDFSDRHAALESVEEANELLVATPSHAKPDHSFLENVLEVGGAPVRIGQPECDARVHKSFRCFVDRPKSITMMSMPVRSTWILSDYSQ
jgi:hypothetical protein